MTTIAHYSREINASLSDTVLYTNLYQVRHNYGMTPGIESLHIRLLGSSHISTEGLLDAVKGIISKVKNWLSKAYEKTIVKMNELIAKFKKLEDYQLQELKDIKSGKLKLSDETTLPISPKGVATTLKVAGVIIGTATLGVVGKRYMSKAKQGDKEVQQQIQIDRATLEKRLDEAEEIKRQGIKDQTKAVRGVYFTRKGRLNTIREARSLLERGRSAVNSTKQDINTFDRANEQPKKTGSKLGMVFHAAAGFVTRCWGKVVSIFSWLFSKLSRKHKTEE